MSTIWKIVITVIVTAGIAGGGTYYFMNQKTTSDKNGLKSQITSLNSQVSSLNKTITASKADTSVNTTTPSSTASTSSTSTTSTGSSSITSPSSSTSAAATSPVADSNGIKVGSVTTDSTALAELQASVDDGHQPWRLDPLSLAQGDASTYGFTQADTDAFTIISQAASAGVAEISASHNNKSYRIDVTKPVPGDGKIYVISKITAL